MVSYSSTTLQSVNPTVSVPLSAWWSSFGLKEEEAPTQPECIDSSNPSDDDLLSELLQRTMKESIFITNAAEFRILETKDSEEGMQQDGFWNELNMPRAAVDMDLYENEFGLESKEEVCEQLKSLNALLQAQPVRSGSPPSLFDYDSNYFLRKFCKFVPVIDRRD
ncbi:UNVERIFIED_CONTAM: hypothetical protein HDU68_012724 [Siphonaria sp. JEL0065]|nr:hypothetical protein HDU68_012724 [Siphonaria sp. JEL0065]